MLEQRESALTTDNARHYFALVIFLPCLTTFFVIVRFLCRRFTKASVGLEDWLVLVALVRLESIPSSLAITLIAIQVAFYGLTAANLVSKY